MGAVCVDPKTSLNSFIPSDFLANFSVKNLGATSLLLLTVIYYLSLLLIYLIFKGLITKIYLEKDYNNLLKSIIAYIQNSRMLYLLKYKLTSQYLLRKVDLAYDILRCYMFNRKSTIHWFLERNRKVYKVSLNSWISFIFKLLFFIGFIYYLTSDTITSILTLTTPLLKTDLEVDVEIKQHQRRIEYLRSLKKNGKLRKSGIKVKVIKRSKKYNRITLSVKGLAMDQSEGYYRETLEKLFDAFTNNVAYKNYCKTKAKGVFIQFKDKENDEIRPLHSTVIITKDTTFEEYYTEISPFLRKYWKPEYGTSTSDEFNVSVYDLEAKTKKVKSKTSLGKMNFSTSATIFNGIDYVELNDPHPVKAQFNSKVKKLPSIKPIKLKNDGLKRFCCMDIETVIINKKTQEHIPIAISTYSKEFSEIFLIDLVLFKKNKTKAVQKLFKDYMDYMCSLQKDYVIFAHNLGSYDGYFLYKNIMSILEDVDDITCLVDNDNKFITVTLNNYFNERKSLTKLVWKDSLRIFPGSLDSICKQFNVEGKLSKYKEEYNSIDLFNTPILLEEFKAYSMQDSIALYNAMSNAQELNYKNYRVDICDIVSTASLSLRIYRSHFLHEEIPLLKSFEEKFVRESYLGGATDYYKAKGENLHCYDVNSLYPYAMLKPIPYKAIAKHNDLSGVNVKDFKGFVLAKVTSPDYIRHPIVALKHEGRTIYPLGTWYGVYFADYLAKAQEYGYKIDLIYGIEFEYKTLFEGYINHFYDIKKNSTGSLRYLAKLQLNSLYGMFGRKGESLEVVNVKTEDVWKYISKRVVKNIIEFNNGYSVLICENNLDFEVINSLNLKAKTDIHTFSKSSYSNVAIASAITSYAQMTMMDYKNHPDFDVYYTDTDSLFTNRPIPSHLVGKELGRMKNETLDKYGVESIAEATFVGLKKYGLRVIDNEGNIKDSSTFAGVPKDTLTFDEVNSIHNGIPLVRKLKDRFNKSFNSLSIKTQSNVKLEVSNKRDKELINNVYIPKTVNLSEKQNFDGKLIDKLVNRHIRLKKKYSNDNPFQIEYFK
jgi:hypothetical protein